jgi:hypothetical protein
MRAALLNHSSSYSAYSSINIGTAIQKCYFTKRRKCKKRTSVTYRQIFSPSVRNLVHTIPPSSARAVTVIQTRWQHLKASRCFAICSLLGTYILRYIGDRQTTSRFSEHGTCIPKRSLDFFNLLNPSSRTMALGLTQPLTEMSTRNIPRR